MNSSSNEQSNINSLNHNTDVTVFPLNMPTVTLATLGIEGATEYTSGKDYHRYIPILNKDGRLDKTFLEGVEVNISLPTTGPYYYVDSAKGDDTNSGSVQNPFKTLAEAVRVGSLENPKITSFVLRSRVFDEEVVDLTKVFKNETVDPENPFKLYIIGDGYGKSTIKNLILKSTDTLESTDTEKLYYSVYLKDVNVETLTIATADIINVYLVGSTSLSIVGFEEYSIDGVTPNSTEFNLYTDINVTVKPGVYEKANRFRIISSDALQYDETTTLNEKIVSIDESIGCLNSCISAHKEDTNNPHNVTTAQIGALPLCGGVMQGCIYYDTESDDTRLTDEGYVDFTIDSCIAVHNTDEDAHSNILCNYAKLTDLNDASACITGDINAHINNKDNPHELYLIGIPAMQADTKDSHLWLKNGSLTIYNDIAVPTTFTITSGAIVIKSGQEENFKSKSGFTNAVFRRYPYNRVARNNSYSNIDVDRIYYYFMESDLVKLVSPETGEYVQLSDDWLRGYVYITLNTKDGRDVNNTESPWLANRISIVPHPLDGSDFSADVTELVGSEHSDVGYAFGGSINNNNYLNSDDLTLISKIDEGLVNEGSLVLTSRDIDTTGILNCIGEIKDSIDGVNNKTSSLESGLDNLTDEFDKLKDDLLCGGEVTIIATETKAIVSEDKKATVSITEDNRLEMCVKSTLNGVDTCTSTYFLTESYDANTVTPLINRVKNIEDIISGSNSNVELGIISDESWGCNSVIIGSGSGASVGLNDPDWGQCANNDIAIGNYVYTYYNDSIGLGSCIITCANSTIAIGSCISIGSSDSVIAIGTNITNNDYDASSSVIIGNNAKAYDRFGVAIGFGANSAAAAAVQIGMGENYHVNTLQINSYKLLTSDGFVPPYRLEFIKPADDGEGYDESSGLVYNPNIIGIILQDSKDENKSYTLKITNGALCIEAVV